jgi:hypothetical protein
MRKELERLKKLGFTFALGFEVTMDIYAQPGTKVIFRANGGYDWEKEKAKKAGFIVDQPYTVKYMEIGHSSTNAYFEEMAGGWNSCLFADLPEAA